MTSQVYLGKRYAALYINAKRCHPERRAEPEAKDLSCFYIPRFKPGARWQQSEWRVLSSGIAELEGLHR
jgi:hypothetical protein